MIFGSSKNKIIRLEEENKYLKNKINLIESMLYDLKEQNIYINNINKLNKFYSDVCLNINDNNKYLNILQKINKFYKDNNLFSEGVVNRDIENHIKGKQGEIYLLNKFNEYIRDNRKLEYFYDFNLQNETQNLQFDFIAIAKNNIYIIEVKNLNAKQLEICRNEKGYYYIKAYYENNKNYNITFNSMLKRHKLIDDIIKKFQVKYNDMDFNVFNIMVFIEDNKISGVEKYDNISRRKYNIEIPMNNDKLIQILSGEENINEYFKNYTSKIYKKDYNDRQNHILDDFTKFLKSDISFRESTDKNYIIQRVYEFFEQVYKCVEEKNLDLKFNN